MSDRPLYDSSPPEELTDDDLPTEERTLVDDILTDDDIDDVDDRIETVERRLPPGLFEQKLPRFEMTGTITLPRDFLSVPEPVTVPMNQPPPVAVPSRVEPPPKPARPSLRSWVTPPPKPVRALPAPGPPPPPAPRLPSVPPPLPPPQRPARTPSLPPPLPPPAAAPRPPSLTPPAAPPRPASLPPPAPPPRPASLPPPPRMPSSPEVPASFSEAPTPAPQRKKKKARPRPPEPAVPAKSDATRPFPLQAPRQEQYRTPQPEPSPSHTPPPLTASTPPPPPLVAERSMPRAPVYSEPPPALPSAPPRVDRVPSMLEIAATYLHLTNSKTLSAAIGVFAALVVGMLVIMVAATLRDDPNETPAPSGPVVAARPLTTSPRVTAPPATTPVAPATTQAPAPPPPPLGACRLVTVPRRIAGPAMPNVVPMAASAPGPSRVALGYASGRNHADGIIVNLDDLSVEPRYSEELTGPVFRVTPLTDRAPVTFAVDRDDPRIQNLRTLPSSPPLRVGTSYFGFVRLNEATSPTVIWPGARFEGISEPAFAVTERDGHGIAFRSGRGSGDVLAGWLTPSGTADGDLVRVDAGAREVGAPSMAAGDKSVVVAFAARGPGEPWHIRVAVAPRGKVPNLSRELAPLQSGGAEAIAPVIVALPSGGFLLQWLEGPAGARRVMVRTLDEKLRPQGVPLELAQGAAVQDAPGALVLRSGKVLAVHLAAADKSVELRGAVLVCG